MRTYLATATAGEVGAADPAAVDDPLRQFTALHFCNALALALGEVGPAAGVADVGVVVAAQEGLVLRAALLEVRHRLAAALDGATVLVGLVRREKRLAAGEQEQQRNLRHPGETIRTRAPIGASRLPIRRNCARRDRARFWLRRGRTSRRRPVPARSRSRRAARRRALRAPRPW